MPLEADAAATLVAWICWYARQRDTSLTTVQLVKYLYLADLYQAQRASGQTLTGWPWAFVHFGPYCSEAMATIDRAVELGLVTGDLRESRYDDEKEFRLYGPGNADEPPVDPFLPLTVQSGLKKAIATWADDTAGLLDHVYFETEPMQGIEPRALLDFSRATLPAPIAPPVPPLKLSEKKLRKGREILARLQSRTTASASGTPLDTGPHDDAYREALSTDEAGETPQGPIELDISGLQPGEDG
jgi:hypothetical protein